MFGEKFMKTPITRLLILMIVAFTMSRCAQYVPPSGGKKDKIPPKLLSTTPKNQSTGFGGQGIELEFDEYIILENLNQQLLITPELDGTYTFKQKPKGLVLSFNKPLKKDVTYTLNFRNAIKDFSERNPAKNVKLVFSTGSQIDSLSVSGEVKDVETNAALLDAVVGLYKWTDTSKVSKNKPYYFTRTDSSGRFTLENIQAGDYRIFSLVDLNNNLLFEANKEKVGFIQNPIKLNKNVEDVNIGIVSIRNEKIKQQQTRPMAYYYDVEYSRGIQELNLTFKNPSDSLPYLLSNEKVLRFFNTKNIEDTLRVKAEVKDSLGQEFKHDIKVKFRPKPRKEEGSREKLSLEPQPKVGEEVSQIFELTLTFNKPIQNTQLPNITLLADTTQPQSLTTKDVKWNRYNNRLTIQKQIPAKNLIRVLIPKGLFISIEGDSSQVFKNDYSIRKEENYGIISGTVKNATNNFIVQLLDMASKKIVAEIQNKPNYQFNFVKAGTYQIRLIDDRNNNGRWDFGDPDVFLLPERMLFFPNELRLKQNFELTGNDFDLK